MTGRLWFAITAALVCSLSNFAHAQDYTRENLRIPMSGTGSRGLEAILLRPAATARYPLVLINHGSPRNASDRKTMSPTASSSRGRR